MKKLRNQKKRRGKVGILEYLQAVVFSFDDDSTSAPENISDLREKVPRNEENLNGNTMESVKKIPFTS